MIDDVPIFVEFPDIFDPRVFEDDFGVCHRCGKYVLVHASGLSFRMDGESHRACWLACIRDARELEAL